jgi:hypothetical protein
MLLIAVHGRWATINHSQSCEAANAYQRATGIVTADAVAIANSKPRIASTISLSGSFEETA